MADDNTQTDEQTNDEEASFDFGEPVAGLDEVELGQETDEDSTDVEESGTETEETDASDKDQGTINQESVNKKINKLHFEKKSAEEDKAKAEARALELEKKLAEATKEELPEVPGLPDYMDPQYAEKMQQRDEIIVQHSREQAKLDAANAANAAKQQEQANAAVTKITEAKTSFSAVAAQVGLDDKLVTAAEETLVKYIPGKQELAMHLLTSETGPLDVLYLSQNPVEMEKISKMSDINAAMYIANNITPKSGKLAAQTKTNAPKPMTVPAGGSKSASDDPILAGATFE